MDETHPRPEDYAEGKDAARRFEGIVKAVLAVPPAEMQKREKTWRKKKAQKKPAT